MPNKRIKKKIAKTNFCKSPVWHGEKIKTKDVRVQTYHGKFCDYGLAVRERPKLKSCPVCGRARRAGKVAPSTKVKNLLVSCQQGTLWKRAA